ncbi:MAG: hypothetical protein BWY82_01664 [Verrucomicrobia bacterium ADurb.Bin474]|nr:MAG: hypothetical protein BWY82_01664 [Verrucomicrobia bacterium ADurb.Bin474]
MLHPLPLVQQARIDSSQQTLKVNQDLIHRIRPIHRGQGTLENMIHLRQVPQQQPFNLLNTVGFDVVAKAAVAFIHLPDDRLRMDVFLTHPGMLTGKGIEGVINEIPLRLWILEGFEAFHSLVILDSSCFPFRDLFLFHLHQLSPQDGIRILNNRFCEGNHLERVFGGIRIQ